MDNLLKNLISVITTKDRASVKQAQKEVERFWHNFYIPHREKGRQAFLVFLEEMKRFDKIQDIDHQTYFINTLKWPFWVIGEEYFEEWADFILKYIQHPSGKIRQAIIKAADYLVIDITADLRHINQNDKKITRAELERIERNKSRFCIFVASVEELLGKYEEPRFRPYKYVRSMPSSVYKSLQMLITEALLRSDYYEELYEQYLRKTSTPKLAASHQATDFSRLIMVKISYDEAVQAITKKNSESIMVPDNWLFVNFLDSLFVSYPLLQSYFPPTVLGFSISNQAPESGYILKDGDEIIIKENKLEDTQRAVEKELADIIGYYQLDITIDQVKQIIFNEQGKHELQDLSKIFTAKAKNIRDINRILAVLSGLWNYSPHKVLNGLSPAQKMIENHRKQNNQTK